MLEKEAPLQVGTRYVKNKPKLFEKITETEKQNKWVNDSKRWVGRYVAKRDNVVHPPGPFPTLPYPTPPSGFLDFLFLAKVANHPD